MPGILDRYILQMFVKVLAITFVSMSGLFVVIHGMANVEEFITYASEDGVWVVFEFYGPQVLAFFDRTGPMIVLLSAIFALTTLMRTNELVAIMAAGISKGRVIQPLLIAAAVVSLVGVLNREWWIPAVRDQLMRTAQDWRGTQTKSLRPIYDYRTDIFLGGRQTIAAERKIVAAHFRLPSTPQVQDFGHQIIAESATYLDRDEQHPAGYLLDKVTVPSSLMTIPSASIQDAPTILSPADHAWLTREQCFVVSDVTFEQLAGGSQYRHLASSRELIASLRNPSLDLGAESRVMVHARLVQPLLDMTLFVLGLPLVLKRDQRNVFVAAGLCVGLVAVFFITVLICHGLGANYLISPALGAWLPLLIFAPAAYTAAVPLWK